MSFPLVNILFFFLSTSAAIANTDFSKANWERVSNHNGIEVYQWQVPGSPIIAFKSTGVIEAPIAKVTNALIDVDRRPEWMPDLGSTKIVRWLNPHERIEYIHVRTPFIIKDRDFVLMCKASFDIPNKAVLLEFSSIEDAEIQPTDKIRAKLYASSYKLSKIENGAKTLMEVQIHADPMGTIPHWVVNLFQKDHPRKVLEALRRQVAKNDVGLFPEVLQLFGN